MLSPKGSNKVFGIGLQKTGTSSLHKALQILGYKSRHSPMAWRNKIYHNGDYAPIKDNWDAITNFGEWFFPQLDAMFPMSKFILTLRDMESWLVSLEGMYSRAIPPGFDTLMDVFGIRRFNEDRCRYIHSFHTKTVLEYFRNRTNYDSLFIFKMPFKWEPLCIFLDKPIPDVPYPHANQTKNKRPHVQHSQTRRLQK